MELNSRSIEKTINNIRLEIQDEKVFLARQNLKDVIRQGRFSKEYRSYVGGIVDRNAYDEPDKFFRVMLKSPQKAFLPFTFYPTGVFNRERLFQALKDAVNIFEYQTSRFIGATRAGSRLTGNYQRSLIITKLQDNVRDVLTSPEQVLSESGAFILQIFNVAEYASTLEKNAVYFARVGGILFFAAEQLKAKYPDLGIRFTYYKGANLTAGISHVMMVPVLTIGDKRFVKARIKKPGRNYRKRSRASRVRR